MLHLALVVFTAAVCVRAQDGAVPVPENNKTQCVQDMVDWCNGMNYPQQGVGLAVLSVTHEDPKGFFRVFCSSDSDGTNCTRNKESWFTCSPDKVLTYKGKVLSMDTPVSELDDDICKTADKAFNDLFIQNLRCDNTTMKNEIQKGMEAFFDQIALMQEQIEMIQRALKGIPYVGDFWTGFDSNFFAQSPGVTTVTSMPDDNSQKSTDQTNQIEKE